MVKELNMPLPSPRGKEEKQSFIKRCMGDETMKEEFPENKQRVAVCYSQWRKAKNESSFKDKVSKYIKELNLEAGPKGWNIIMGSGRKINPAQMPQTQKKTFDKVKRMMKKDGLLEKLRREANDKPDIVFYADRVEVYDEKGNLLKTYKGILN